MFFVLGPFLIFKFLLPVAILYKFDLVFLLLLDTLLVYCKQTQYPLSVLPHPFEVATIVIIEFFLYAPILAYFVLAPFLILSPLDAVTFTLYFVDLTVDVLFSSIVVSFTLLSILLFLKQKYPTALAYFLKLFFDT